MMAKMDHIIGLEGFRHGLGVFTIKQGRKKLDGILDTNGNIVVEPCWGRADVRSPQIVALWKTRAGYFYYRSNDRYFDVVRHTFLPENVCDYAESCKRMITRKGRKQGLEDLDGNILIPHKYRELWFRDNVIVATDFKGKQGLFDTDGRELQPVQYDELRCYESNYGSGDASFVGRIADDRFVVDASGQRLLEKHYDYLDTFNAEEYCIFGEKHVDDVFGADMLYGVIDKHENIIIPARYDYLRWLDNDRLGCGRSDGRYSCGAYGNIGGESWSYGVIDCQGNETVPCVYPNSLWRGPARTYIVETPDTNYGNNYRGRVTGVVDETGRIVLPFRNWWIESTSIGVFRVYDYELERFGLYSSSGEEILPFEFEGLRVGDTLDYIAVRKDNERYYINSRGERVLL